MSVDPFLGVFIGLAVWVGIGIFGAWFAGLFEAPPEKKSHDVPAE